MSSASLRREVARSVDAPAALVPHFDRLFMGMDALGSMPRRMARLLEQAGVRSRHRVLDLACGKGAVAVMAASRIGCRVTGVDACGSFIASARALADRRGVGGRCRFAVGDVTALRPSRHDCAMMLGLLPLAEAAGVLRRQVRRGGVYLIDDCWWDDRLAEPDNPACFTRDGSLAVIQRLGDRVERIDTPAPSVVRRLNDGLYARLRANARAIADDTPRLRPHLRSLLKRQRDANDLLGDVLRPAVWVVRRGGERP